MINDIFLLRQIDNIIFILYKVRTKITNIELITFFYQKIEDILENKYHKNPIFYSENPLKFTFILHILLQTFNQHLRLSNEDFNRLSDDFVKFCSNMIEFLP